VRSDIRLRKERVRDALARARDLKSDADAVEQYCQVAAENAKALLGYQEKDIPLENLTASALLKTISKNKESLMIDALKREISKTRKTLAATTTEEARLSVLYSAVSKIERYKYVTRYGELLGPLERELKTLTDQINGEALQGVGEPGIPGQADTAKAGGWRAGSSIQVGPQSVPLQRRRH
jgi:hypothetical protein